MLRNIANMKRADVDRKIIQQGLQNLKSSMLLPLDFLKTARMNPEFERDIEDSMSASYANLPKLPGKTLFIVDVSGSMGAPMSSKSDFTRYDAACAMAMLAVNQCEDYEIVTTAFKGVKEAYTNTLIEIMKAPQEAQGLILIALMHKCLHVDEVPQIIEQEFMTMYTLDKLSKSDNPIYDRS